MDLLESPLEALAFRYSAALAGSAWAWLAVLFAAALSLWRIRAVGCPPEPDPQPERFLQALAPAPKLQISAGPAESAKPSAQSRDPVDDAERSGTSGRFMTYFHVDCGRHVTEEEECYCDGTGGEEEERPLPLWKCEGWRGDLGWYRHLDLTAFDGSVVRLWDRDRGSRRRRI